MKNAALVYSGQIRYFKECYPTHLKHIIQTNPDYKFHVFAHFWDDPSLYGKPYWELYPNRGHWSKENIASFIDCSPESYVVQKPITFATSLIPDPRFAHPIQNVFSMFFSMYRAGIEMDNHSIVGGTKFDVVFRLRTDLYFFRDFILSNYDLNNLWVGEQYAHMPYGVNDMFAFGAYDQMIKYFQAFPNLELLVKSGCAVNPECLLGFYLHYSGLKLSKTPQQYAYYDLYRNICLN